MDKETQIDPLECSTINLILTIEQLNSLDKILNDYLFICRRQYIAEECVNLLKDIDEQTKIYDK